MANLNVRVEDTIKAQADALFLQLGMNTTTAVNIFLRQAIQYGGIPFELKADPFYSVENQTRLVAAAKRMEETGGTIHELVEVDDE